MDHGKDIFEEQALKRPDLGQATAPSLPAGPVSQRPGQKIEGQRSIFEHFKHGASPVKENIPGGEERRTVSRVKGSRPLPEDEISGFLGRAPLTSRHSSPETSLEGS